MTDTGKPYSGGRTGNSGFGRKRSPEGDAAADRRQREAVRRESVKARRDARLLRIRSRREGL